MPEPVAAVATHRRRYDSHEEVIDSFRASPLPLSEAEKERMRRGRISSGVETDEDDIDDVLYG